MRPPLLPCLPPLLFLALQLSGCAHSSRAERVQLDAMREAIEARTFEVTVLEARARLVALGQRGDMVVTAESELGCDGRPCPVLLGSPGRAELQLLLLEAEGGGTRVEVQEAQTPRARTLLTHAWWALGEEGLAEAQDTAVREAELVALEEWRTFQPRWGPTGAAFVVGGSRQVGFGARMGVRRWSEPHVMAGAALEYERGEVRTGSSEPPAPSHAVTLPLRVELAPWTEFSAAYGLPEASLSLFAGPGLLFSPEQWRGAQLGYRVGAGIQVLHVSPMLVLPLLLEVHVQQHGAERTAVRDMRVLVGAGF